MRKKAETPDVEQPQAGTTEQTGITIADMLKQDGTVTITAATREDLFQQFDRLKTELAGKTLATGAVAHNHDIGKYILRIYIIEST